MCAIFGYVARGVSTVDVRLLERIAKGNITRGPHAFGFAWIDSRGRMHSFKQKGKITDDLGILAMARDAKLFIGHLRFATHGDPAQNINNHPHPCDGGWLVHNGVVSNYADLLASGLYPNSDCDSEAIALLIEAAACNGEMARAVHAVRQTRGPLAIMGLWKPGVLVAVRRGNPLHLSDKTDGTYLATLASSLPGKVREVAEGEAYKFTLSKGERNVRIIQTGKTHAKSQLSRHR